MRYGPPVRLLVVCDVNCYSLQVVSLLLLFVSPDCNLRVRIAFSVSDYPSRYLIGRSLVESSHDSHVSVSPTFTESLRYLSRKTYYRLLQDSPNYSRGFPNIRLTDFLTCDRRVVKEISAKGHNLAIRDETEAQ